MTERGAGATVASIDHARAASAPRRRPREEFWNWPNTITMFRIAVVPIMLLVPFFESKVGCQVFAWCFIVAAVSDIIDGWLARRGAQVTNIGKLLDPLADKLLVTAALVSLVQMELAPAWMVAVILGREFAVTVLRAIAHARGQSLPASPLGKIKLVAQVVAILILILGQGHMQGFFVVGQIALWVATITALVSAVDYYRRFPPARAS